jgi:hypothetical protein
MVGGIAALNRMMLPKLSLSKSMLTNPSSASYILDFMVLRIANYFL